MYRYYSVTWLHRLKYIQDNTTSTVVKWRMSICFFKYKAAYIHDMRNCAIVMCLDTGITTVFGLIGRDKLSPLIENQCHFINTRLDMLIKIRNV
jgi:hypothetical protein